MEVLRYSHRRTAPRCALVPASATSLDNDASLVMPAEIASRNSQRNVPQPTEEDAAYNECTAARAR